jgi:DNA polymerase III subunit delta'
LFPWLKPIFDVVLTNYSKGVLPHAVVFESVVNVGVEKLLEKLSASILCENLDGLNLCGKCYSCMNFMEENTHPDYIEVKLEGNGLITLDAIQSIIESLSTKSYYGGARVIVIYDIDKLHTSAANALLKILEEPRSNIYFLLTSSDIEGVLDTIRSRGLSIPITISVEGVRSYLSSHGDLSMLESNLSVDDAIRISHKSPFLALELLTKSPQKLQDFFKIRDFLLDSLKNLRCPVDMAEKSLEIATTKEIINWLIVIYSDLYKVLIGTEFNYIYNQDKTDELKILASMMGEEGLYSIYRYLLKLKKLRSNIIRLNQSLLLENLYIKISGEINEFNTKAKA